MAGRTRAIIEKLTSTVAAVEYRARTLLTAESSGKTTLSEILQVGKTSVEYLVGKFVRMYFRFFEHSTSVQDTASKSIRKGASDEVNFSDDNYRGTTKGLTDLTGTNDKLQRTVQYGRGFSDVNLVTDLKSSAISKPATDTLSLTDTRTIVNIYSRSFTTTVLGTDDVNGAGADDDQNITFFKNTGNLSQVYDRLSFQNTYNRQFSNNSSITDLTSLGPHKYFYHYSNVVDSFDRVLTYSRNFNHISHLSDSTKYSIGKVLQNSFATSDSVKFSIDYFRQFNSVATATDDINGAAADDDQNITFFKNTGDLSHINDLTEIVAVFNRAFTHRANVADLAKVALEKPLIDSSQILDSVRNLVELQKSDGLQFEDSLSRTVVFSRTPLDTSVTSDRTAVAYSKVLSNTSNITDSFFFTNVYNRSALDITNLTDSKTLAIRKGVLDSLNLTELLSFQTDYNRNLSDQTSVSDTRAITYSKNISDQISLQDSITQIIGYGKVSADLLNITDDVNGAGVDDDQTITFFKNLPSELVNIASTVSKGAGKGVQETLALSSQGIILNQSYGADYFAQDYVGVSRSFT